MSFRVVSAILRGGWLLDKSWADAHMPLVVSVLKGEGSFAGLFSADDNENPEATLPRQLVTAASVYRIGYYTDVSQIPDGSIAMINISGPILKSDGPCSSGSGSVSKAELIQRADNAPNIKGIILDIDSPGGQVAGTTSLANAIKNAKKPTIAMINDGIAASAAMWVASAADEIYCTQKTDMVGSVGVYTTLYDYNAYMESKGLKVHEIYAPGSEDKNGDFREALKGNYELLQQDLKVIRDAFVSTVEENRAGKLKSDEWQCGKMFFAKEATRIGLVDGQKSVDQIIKRMDELIARRSATSSKNNTNNMAFEKTLTAAGATEFAVVEGGFMLSEENLNSIEAYVAKSEGDLAKATDDLQAASAAKEKAEGDLATANSAIQEKENEIATLKAENAKLQKQPAAEVKNTVADKDADVVGTGEKISYKDSAENPFNQIADGLMGKPKSDK